MIARRIVYLMSEGLLVLLLFVGLSVGSFAQSPNDLYQPGPNPIAPELPNRDLAPNGQNNGETASDKDDLEMLNLDLKQLSQVPVRAPALDMEVSTVSRTESTVGRSPAAVFVITSEMIRRSGATCVPELLRMVPGLDVARVDSHTWVITCRGFSERFANKLLVQIDGRSVYNPLFSGVYWDSQDILLNDIERIEVIRGPGATIWGANAVNGVINILTKRANDTQGTMISSGGGSHDLNVNGVRVGGSNGEGFFWRVDGKQFERGAGYLPQGSHDDWRIGRGSFRIDWELDRCKCNTLTVQGDHYGGTEGLQMYEVNPASPSFLGVVTPDEEVSGTDVLARWTHVFSEDSDFALQMYYDHTLRDQPITRQEIHTFDIDFQHRFSLGDRNALIWGLEFRQVHDDLTYEPFTIGFIPRERTLNTFSGFIQDEITLVEDQLFFIVGTKLENNSLTGFEYQPSARALWTPDDRHSLWGAISRAVRVPSQFDQNGYLTLYPTQIDPAPVYVFPRYVGNPDIISEDLVAYELGYRTQVNDKFSYDIALFYNVYDNLINFQAGPWQPYGTNFIAPLNFMNGMTGETYGIEISADWAITDRWRISPCYSFLHMQLHSPARRTVEQTEGLSPCNTAYLRSYYQLSENWQCDMAFRYVDNRPTMDIPSYITMDLRLGWTPSERFEVAVVGRNLFQQNHFEYGQDTFFYLPSEVQREVYAMFTWRH